MAFSLGCSDLFGDLCGLGLSCINISLSLGILLSSECLKLCLLSRISLLLGGLLLCSKTSLLLESSILSGHLLFLQLVSNGLESSSLCLPSIILELLLGSSLVSQLLESLLLFNASLLSLGESCKSGFFVGGSKLLLVLKGLLELCGNLFLATTGLTSGSQGLLLGKDTLVLNLFTLTDLLKLHLALLFGLFEVLGSLGPIGQEVLPLSLDTGDSCLGSSLTLSLSGITSPVLGLSRSLGGLKFLLGAIFLAGIGCSSLEGGGCRRLLLCICFFLGSGHLGCMSSLIFCLSISSGSCILRSSISLSTLPLFLELGTDLFLLLGNVSQLILLLLLDSLQGSLGLGSSRSISCLLLLNESLNLLDLQHTLEELGLTTSLFDVLLLLSIAEALLSHIRERIDALTEEVLQLALNVVGDVFLHEEGQAEDLAEVGGLMALDLKLADVDGTLARAVLALEGTAGDRRNRLGLAEAALLDAWCRVFVEVEVVALGREVGVRRCLDVLVIDELLESILRALLSGIEVTSLSIPDLAVTNAGITLLCAELNTISGVDGCFGRIPGKWVSSHV